MLFRPIYETACYHEINDNSVSMLEPYYQIASEMGFKIVQNSYLFQACEACSGNNFFYIMPDLTIWKCINDLAFSDACIGYLDTEGQLHFNAKNVVKWASCCNCFSEPRCKECKLLPDCFGGCTLYRAKHGERLCKDFVMTSLPYLY